MYVLLIVISSYCFSILELLDVRQISSERSHMMISLVDEGILIQWIAWLGFVLSQSWGYLDRGILIVDISLEVMVESSSGGVLLLEWHLSLMCLQYKKNYKKLLKFQIMLH